VANNRDVELRIRARDYSQKTLKQVTDAISEMSRAQDAQRASAEKGETSLKELEASYRKLESAGQALLKLNSLVEVYKRQTAALEEQRVKLEAARVKQEALNKKYREAEKVSKTMELQMGRANRALEAQTRRFAEAESRVGKTASELQRYGVATNNLADTQSKIVANVARVNGALERQEKIISQAPAAAKRAAAAAIEQAKADNLLTEAKAREMARTEQAAYAQNKIIDSLRRQADQALAAARSYQTLGRVVASTRLDTGSNLAGQISQIVSPAQAARATLDGLEKQVTQLSVVTRNAKGELVGASAALKNLQAAQNSAIGMARLIDTFRNQVAAVRTAREEFRVARADVLNLANQMRSASGDTQNLGAQMQAAQQRLNAATGALRNASEAARAAQGALRGAGIDTQNLSGAEDRLRNASGSASRGIRDLTNAINENGGAAENAGKKYSFFAEETRKSLGIVQRLRGEILALTTAYVGIQGAVNLAAGAIDMYKIRQQSLIKISTVVGHNQEAVNAEWNYMIGLSDKLGLKLRDVAAGYTSFAVAAKSIGLSLQETKFIFESVSKAGRVFHLSADDMQGVFRAMQQMLSKGQVYAEELTGQLGERLPGAVALFAKGMNMTTAELLKAMQNGEISGEAVINFAREQAKAIDAELAVAEKGVDAMEARAANAMDAFKLALADAGFIDAYVNMLAKITEFLRSPDGKKGAQELGHAFAQLADAVVWCIDNVNSLIVVLQVMAGLKITGILIGMAKKAGELATVLGKIGQIGDKVLLWLSTFGARLAAARGAVGLLGIAIQGLARALPIIGWALLAFDIGAIFYEQSATFRKACDEVLRDFKNLGNQLVAAVSTPTAAVQDLTYAIVRPITTMFADTLNRVAKWIADVLRLIPGVGDSLADFALNVGDNLTKENRDMFQNVSKIWDDVNKKWVQMNDDMVAKHGGTMTEVVRQALKAKADLLQADVAIAAGFKYTEDPGTGPTTRDREIKKNQKAIDAAQKKADKELMNSREALMRKNLKGRLALVDERFEPQVKAAKAIGGKEGEAQLAQLQKIIALEKQVETNEYNASQRAKPAIDKRARAIEALTEKYKGLKASVEVKETNQDPTSTLQERTQAAINKMQVQYNNLRADAAKIGGTEGKLLTDQLNKLQQVNTATLTNKMQLDEVERLQKKVNSLLATRKARIDEINSKREAGVISEDQQVAGVIGVNNDSQAGISSALDQLSSAGQEAKALLGPEAWAQLQANIAAARASMSDLTGTYTQMSVQIVNGVLNGMDTAISSIADGIQNVVLGTQSMGEAFTAAGVAMLQFFSDLLRQIAMAIIKQMVLNALAGLGGAAGSVKGGISSAAAAAGGTAAGGAAGAKHNGGIIGSVTSGGQQMRGMNPSWFANAQRYHDGGLPGLKSDEVPTILQKGEQVLDKNDPANILNQNRSSAGSYSPQNMRFVFVDDRAKVPEAMNTAEGEMAVLQILRRNAPSVRNIVKSNKGGRNG